MPPPCASDSAIDRVYHLFSAEVDVSRLLLRCPPFPLLLKGWVKANPTVSETGRAVREYRLTPSGRKRLDVEQTNYRRVTNAITTILDTA